MSLNRKTYSPMSHTYSYSNLSTSYSTNISPSYSYSRVTTYLDALQRDETITKLKKELNTVKTVQMRYHSLLQQIALAQKQNRLLQSKNNQIQQEYISKIQQTRSQTTQYESQLNLITQRLQKQEKNVDQVEEQIEMMIQQLKKLKIQEQNYQTQNKDLQKQVNKCKSLVNQLKSKQQQIITKKTTIHHTTKTTSQQMQKHLVTLTQINKTIQKYQQQLQLLKKQSQKFSLQSQNYETIFNKNSILLQNLQRKIKIHEGQNQQFKNQLNQMIQNWNKIKKQSQSDKQSLYQNIIKVQQKSIMLKDILSQLDQTLQGDSTEKKYLKDISTKHGKLTGQNQTLRQVLKLLQSSLNDKKTQENSLMEEINQKIRNDETLKQGIQVRNKELTKLKQKIMNSC